jgi:hypothetical protein
LFSVGEWPFVLPFYPVPLLPQRFRCEDILPMKEFAFLVVVAVLWHYAGPPLLVLATLVFFFIGLWWVAERYPRTTITIVSFLMGLCGRR